MVVTRSQTGSLPKGLTHPDPPQKKKGMKKQKDWLKLIKTVQDDIQKQKSGQMKLRCGYEPFWYEKAEKGGRLDIAEKKRKRESKEMLPNKKRKRESKEMLPNKKKRAESGHYPNKRRKLDN